MSSCRAGLGNPPDNIIRVEIPSREGLGPHPSRVSLWLSVFGRALGDPADNDGYKETACLGTFWAPPEASVSEMSSRRAGLQAGPTRTQINNVISARAGFGNRPREDVQRKWFDPVGRGFSPER